mgnify:CR=1 FL=1
MSIALLLGVAGVAHSVPYTLPTSAELPFSQIQPESGGRTVCATWLDDGACDVPPGIYRLLTYTPEWDGEPARAVTIGGSGSGDGSEPAPANLRVDVYSTRSLELFWDRPAPGVRTRYEVRRDGEVIGVKDGTSFYETNLEPGRTYRYEVARVPRGGPRSALASISATTDGGLPPPPSAAGFAPANLRADVYSTRSLELFWDRPAPGVQTRYEIRRNGVPIAIKNGTSFYETGLEPGQGYRYEVTRVPSNGARSETARIEISPTEVLSPPTITVASAERLIGVVFDVFAGKGYGAETRALSGLPRELGLEVPSEREAIVDRTLVCDNGGTVLFSSQAFDTVISGETFVFDNCQIDAKTFEGRLVRDDVSSRGGTDLRTRGSSLFVDPTEGVFALDGEVSLEEEGSGLGFYTFGFEGEVEYALGDGRALLNSAGLSLSCGETGSAAGVFAVREIEGTFSTRSPDTGGVTLTVVVDGPFDGTRNVDEPGTGAFTRGRLVASAPDGSRLEMDVDNGDPSSYDVTVTNARGRETLTLPIGPIMERVENSFLSGC